MTGTVAEREARVEGLLIEPLAGLARKRGVGAEAHDKMLHRLRRRLAYMSDANLRGMVDLILRHAGKGTWPDAALVEAWALNLQVPPPSDEEWSYPRTLMQSALGRQAMAEGWAFELYETAKRLGPPPNRYVTRDLKEDAEKNQHRRKVITENIGAGLASEADKRWLAYWHREMQEIEAIQSASASKSGDAA